jgi:hypothetical protein
MAAFLFIVALLGGGFIVGFAVCLMLSLWLAEENRLRLLNEISRLNSPETLETLQRGQPTLARLK